jgi:hypothetical protein
MIKLTPPATREQILEMLFLKMLEFKDFNQMVLPVGLINNPPAKIGHMKVIESRFVESGKVVVLNSEFCE